MEERSKNVAVVAPVLASSSYKAISDQRISQELSGG